jgi:hypothetical protein
LVGGKQVYNASNSIFSLKLRACRMVVSPDSAWLQ